jgi:FemAB family protein
MDTQIIKPIESIARLANQAGLSIVSRRDHEPEWYEVLNNAEYASVSYLPTMVDYQNEYMRGRSEWLEDLSMIVTNDARPAAVWPLWLRRAENVTLIGSNEGPVIGPLFRKDLSEKTRKGISQKCLLMLESLARSNDVSSWQSSESLHGVGLGFWHRLLMERGARVTALHECYADVSHPLEDIRLGVRKSFRPLISKARRLWTPRVVTIVDTPLLDEIRQFHIAVAGRETRSARTWDLQGAAVNRGEAFAVTLRNADLRLVGCGIFHSSRDESLYGVGVYDRTLFDQPLGHLVQMEAIEYAHSRGIHWHRLGDRPYPGDPSPPSEKELSIAYFKEAFATRWTVRLIATCTVPSAPVPPVEVGQ